MRILLDTIVLLWAGDAVDGGSDAAPLLETRHPDREEPVILKRECFFLIIAVASLSATAVQAQAPAAFDRCHNQQTTVDIVDCLGKLTQEADRRLNAAYQKTLKNEEPSGVPALRAAERAWLEYRKQRCAYLTAGEGTIMQVLGADCMATMTKARADELEGDSRGLGPG